MSPLLFPYLILLPPIPFLSPSFLPLPLRCLHHSIPPSTLTFAPCRSTLSPHPLLSCPSPLDLQIHRLTYSKDGKHVYVPPQRSAPREMLGCDLRWERLRVAFPRLGLLLDDVTEFHVCRRVLLHGAGLDDDLSPRRCK